MFENPTVNHNALYKSCAKDACFWSELTFTFLYAGSSIENAREHFVWCNPPHFCKLRSSSNPTNKKNLTELDPEIQNSPMSVTSRIRPMLIRTVFFLQWPILSSAIILTSPSESSHIPRSSSPAVCSLTRQSVSVYSLWTDMCLIERNQHRLNKTNLLTAHSFGLTPYYDPHFPAPHDKHADPRLFLPCAVKPQTKLCSVCESKTDLFHLHCSFYSLRLSSFHTLSFSSFLPSFSYSYLFLWSVL